MTVTVAITDMNRSDEIIYNVLKDRPLTRQEIAQATRYSGRTISRILIRLQTAGYVRAFRLPKSYPTYYETVPNDELSGIHHTPG